MKTWKHWSLWPYYYGTLPGRWWHNRRLAAAGRAPVMIVYYHRIADDAANTWTVSFDELRRRIAWMKRHFDLVSLEEARRRVCEGNGRPCVAVTFDDGYAENCQRALPWLLEQQVPICYFVTTGNVLSGEPFGHDVARGDRFAPNTVEQLRQLAAQGVEIGAHTRTHADLGRLHDADAMYDEMVAATEDLQDAVGVDVRYFAFPYGGHANLTPAAFTLARDAGFHAVCSAYGGFNFPGDDAFHLQRIDGGGPLVRLRCWLTVDPLKRRFTKRFDYQREEVLPRHEQATP